MQSEIRTLRCQRTLSGGSTVLELDGPFEPTRAGQFYMLRTAERWPVLLPRPFSLYDRGDDGSWGSFLLKPVGPGTKALHGLRAGDRLWVVGPLGRGFPESVERPVCIAGGIGLAPFLLLAREHHRRGLPPLRLLFGGRDQEALAGMGDFESLAQVFAATDDGSFGFKGLVSDLLLNLLQRGEVAAGDTVFCCGPDPMMHAIARICREQGLQCYLSLETYMACGYGVCNGCSVEVRGDRFAGWPYARACTQGPVFDAAELVLD
jgi:dihydroorotate dehydrogenase electron transfer subunit